MAVFTPLTSELREAEPEGYMECNACNDEIGLGELFVKSTAIPNTPGEPKAYCALCAVDYVKGEADRLERSARDQRKFMFQMEQEIEAHR